MADPIANGAAQQSGPQLNVQKIYVKDASFEAPNAPHVFQEEGQPRVELNISQKVAQVAESVYEVVLSATVTCTVNDKNAYLAEVQQAGVFAVQGFEPAQLDSVLGSYCPHVLFPYCRQVVSDLVQNGGFPPLLLQPINFEQVYAETQRRRAEAQQQGQAAPQDSAQA
ncbi:MAG TPA: protein-export chaperone SecB [Xanthomonadaceae bacterium]|nr:protein-export chaperone SecB [Xanthomonadaceae bacterium]